MEPHRRVLELACCLAKAEEEEEEGGLALLDVTLPVSRSVMASKLNAFLASVPSNGLASPTRSGTKSLAALTIPQTEEDDDKESKTSREAVLMMMQPSTPQPPYHHHRTTQQQAQASHVKSLASKFDRQAATRARAHRTFSFEIDDNVMEPPVAVTSMESSNQDEVVAPPAPLSISSTVDAPQGQTPAKPPRAMTNSLQSFLAATPSTMSATSRPVKRDSFPGQEASAMKRVSSSSSSALHAPPPSPPLSAEMARFSKLLTKQPVQAIDPTVVRYFSQLPVATISRRVSTVCENDNQLEEEDAVVGSSPSSSSSSSSSSVDPLELLACFQRGETLSVAQALAILAPATQLLAQERNVLDIHAQPQLVVVGDLHGQFQDLVEILHVHGTLPSSSNPFLFLGDYVDRGVASCEIVLTLLALKLHAPAYVSLLRGNHECRALSTFYGFRAECLAKYGPVVYNRMIKCFEAMPLAARVHTQRGTFLAVHGGLSPQIERVEEIDERIHRFMEPEPSGPLCDLLWSDPAKEEDHKSGGGGAAAPNDASSALEDGAWQPNRTRGCSYTFSATAVRTFLKRNGLVAIIRAHELEEEGFKEHFGEDAPVVTVFSAPEYCNTNHNMGATLVIPYATTSSSNDTKHGLAYRQHTRATERERPFTGPSEQSAMLAFLNEHVPFLPTDFYALVTLCRDVRKTLEVAATIVTPIQSSASNVHEERDKHEDLRGSEHDETSTTDAAEAQAQAQTQMAGASMRAQRRRASTGSGFKLCPGFMRFCERYFGVRFESGPSSRSSVVLQPVVVVPPTDPTSTRNKKTTKKRPSLDDMAIGAMAAVDVRTPEPVPLAARMTTTTNPIDVFTTTQWQALRLFFALLDVNGTGVIQEEGFVVLLAEQDSDAYATRDELSVLVDTIDGNSDGIITEQDFLQFAYRALMRWKQSTTTTAHDT